MCCDSNMMGSTKRESPILTSTEENLCSFSTTQLFILNRMWGSFSKTESSWQSQFLLTQYGTTQLISFSGWSSRRLRDISTLRSKFVWYQRLRKIPCRSDGWFGRQEVETDRVMECQNSTLQRLRASRRTWTIDSWVNVLRYWRNWYRHAQDKSCDVDGSNKFPQQCPEFCEELQFFHRSRASDGRSSPRDFPIQPTNPITRFKDTLGGKFKRKCLMNLITDFSSSQSSRPTQLELRMGRRPLS